MSSEAPLLTGMKRDEDDPTRVSAPVAVGGVGGSGTRLVAELLLRLGYYMGGDLNEANDNLWFTLLFKRPEILSCTRRELDAYLRLFLQRMSGGGGFGADERAMVERLVRPDRPQHDMKWLAMRAASFLSPGPSAAGTLKWGWKEPNTHVVLDRLAAALPSLRYIHVARNGLDMAYSSNQNQLALWGHSFLGVLSYPVDPRHSLKYWCRVHRRVLDISNDMPGRFLLLNYDWLCSHPREGLESLLAFLEGGAGATKVDELLALVRPPRSIGRFRAHGLEAFDPEDVEFAASLGFPVA